MNHFGLTVMEQKMSLLPVLYKILRSTPGAFHVCNIPRSNSGHHTVDNCISVRVKRTRNISRDTFPFYFFFGLVFSSKQKNKNKTEKQKTKKQKTKNNKNKTKKKKIY